MFWLHKRFWFKRLLHPALSHHACTICSSDHFFQCHVHSLMLSGCVSHSSKAVSRHVPAVWPGVLQGVQGPNTCARLPEQD